MMEKNIFGQATLEYLLITMLLLVLVFLGFQQGKFNTAGNPNFVETSRIKLLEFTDAATGRINQKVVAPF